MGDYDPLTELDRILDIQRADGNWNYDPYMFGLLNGLIMARSCITGEEPKFYEAPAVWLADRGDGPAETVEASA